jgi:cysteine-rich repeat protein
VASREQCDDGNLLDGDGCSSLCVIETGAVCAKEQLPPNLKSVCQTCGNHKLEGLEVCDDGGASEACAPDCASVALGWQCSNFCVAGPSPVHQPLSPFQTSSSITWMWNLPESFGLPVTMFICQLAPAVYGSEENITVNWTAVSTYNITSNFTQKQQQLITANLSSSTMFVLQVKACSASGCSPFGSLSTAIKTLSLPPKSFGQIANLLQDGLVSQVIECTCDHHVLLCPIFLFLAAMPFLCSGITSFAFALAELGRQHQWALCSVAS